MIKDFHVLFKYTIKVRVLLTLGLVLLGIESLAQIGIIQLQKVIVDNVFLEGHFNLLWIFCCILAVCILFKALLNTLVSQVLLKAQYKLQSHLSDRVLTVLYNAPIEKIRERGVGTYVNYLNGDIDQLTGLICQELPKGIQLIITSVIISIIIAIESPYILITIFICSLVFYFVKKRFEPEMKGISNSVQKNKVQLLNFIEEGIVGTREIIVFDNVSWEKNKLQKLHDAFLKQVIREGQTGNKILLSSEPMRWINILVILGYGGYAVTHGKITIGAFVVLYQFSSQLTDSFVALFKFFSQLWSRTEFVNRVDEVLSHGYKETVGVDVPDHVMSIRFNKINFTYPNEKKKVLDNTELEIMAGQKIALVGESGSGKSTLSKLLMMLYTPQSGEIFINGIPLQRIDKNQWAHHISFVLQDSYLFPDTIRNNLCLGVEYDFKELTRICRLVQIHDDIEKLDKGYNTIIGERGITLSGGQRQRLLLARALLRNTEILVMDEATSALDLETERAVMKAVDDLRRKKTTIVIAHRLSTIQNADTIHFIHKGKVEEQGTHKELVALKGQYAKLVQKESAMQEGIYENE